MARFRLALPLLLALAGPGVAMAKTPWEQLMGRKPQTWTAEDGRFSLDLPVGWVPTETEGGPTHFARTHDGTGVPAEVLVELRPLPPGVKSAHFDAHIQEEMKRRAPGYTVLGRSGLKMDGRDARQTHFRYRALDNTELHREVVQTTLVAGRTGVVLTFETLAGGRQLFEEELKLMIEGFALGGAPSAPSATKRSGGRRKIRAGEMINPNAVGY